MRASAVTRCRVWCLLTIALAAASSTGAPAAAQSHRPDLPGTAHSTSLAPVEIPKWVNRRSLVLLNGLLGGVSAGIVRELGGGSFLRAFPAGIGGGVLVFFGKDVAAQQWPAAGLLGRQIGSLGGSVVQNAAAGRPVLERLELRLGPAGVWVDPRAGSVSAQLDPVAASVFLVGLLHPDMTLDGASSLSAGTPVFRVRQGRLYSPWTGQESGGLEIASVLFLGRLPELDPEVRRAVFAHERVHVVAGDALQVYWGRPLLDWVLPEGKRWRRARSFLDVNLGESIAELIDAAMFRAYASRPGEVEAEALAR